MPRRLLYALYAFLLVEFGLLTWLVKATETGKPAPLSLGAAMILPASFTLWTGICLSWLAGRVARTLATRRERNEMRDVGGGVRRVDQSAHSRHRIGSGEQIR